MTSTATKITAQNIEAGMTIRVRSIDCGWVTLGACTKNSPSLTITKVTLNDQMGWGSNSLTLTTATGERVFISTRQKVEVIG
jgi:hypothetical protein